MLIIAKLFMSDEIEKEIPWRPLQNACSLLWFHMVSHTDGKLELEILAYSYRKLSLYNKIRQTLIGNRVSIT